MSKKVQNRFQSASRGTIAVSEPARQPTAFIVAPSFPNEPQFNRLRPGLATIGFVRLEDIHFEFGSSFLLPFDFDAGPVKRLMAKHPGTRLGVFGHADPVGLESFNKILSGRRAACVYGLLVRKVELWNELYRDHDSNGKDEWGVRSIQVMLRRAGQDPGRADGTLDDPTRAALRQFQNERGLPNTAFDGRKQLDSQTFKLLARAYMDTICVDRSSRRFKAPPTDGEPSDAEFEQFILQKTDFIALGRGDDLKGDVQGCGEFDPIIRFSLSEENELGQPANHAERNRENQPNRRVLILLFKPNTHVDPKAWPCPTFKQDVAGCTKRFFSDAARRRANTDERRLFAATKDTFACRFFQRLHEHAIYQIVSNERLESRFALTQFEGVTSFLTRNEFHSWMLVLFGADIPAQALDTVRQQLLKGEFPNCDIELVEGGIDGHLAAYDRLEKVILIDRTLARRAEKDNDEGMELASALVEEFGHFVDDHIRTELTNIGGDADLDEGAVFGFALVNLKNDIQGEMEFARYTHDGVTATLKMQYEKLRRATRTFFSEQEQIDDARTERFEFFGAGPGGHRNGQQPGSSFGHESIEFVLESAGFAKDSDPVKSELKRTYFGNWLRDFSQVIDPKVVRPPGSSSSNDGFLRASLTEVLDILAREHFQNDPIFQVTLDRCLVYRPDHHIDNPKGLEDARAIDKEFRHAFAPVEGGIDPDLGMKKYIRTPGLPRGSGFSTAAEFIVSELDEAFKAGRASDGFRHLGAALHVVEDYYAHSNFVELALIELGHPGVFPWAGTPIASGNPVLNGKFPIVTGMFGGSDTLVSVLDVAGEHIQNVKPCEAGGRSTGAKIALILLKDKGQSEFARRLEYTLSKFEELKRDFPNLATLSCRLAEAVLRWLKAVIGALLVKSMDLVTIAQQEFENDPKSTDPTHSMLAKDHDVHPLHVMAANMAQIACKDVASAMNQQWLGSLSAPNPRDVALQYLVHPAILRSRSDGAGPPLRGGLELLWEEMKSQARDKGNAENIKRVEGRGWMREQLDRARKEQEELRKRARELNLKKAEEEIEELFRRLKELEKPLTPLV